MNNSEKMIYLYSDEIQEIISQNPHWLIRVGGNLILLLLLSMLGSLWFIRYPDIVKASLRLTSADAPKPVIANTRGYIDRLLARENEYVKKNQELAYISNTAEEQEVLELAKNLKNAYPFVKEGKFKETIKIMNETTYTHLGEVQATYQVFDQMNVSMRAFVEQGFYNKKKRLLEEDIKTLHQINEKLQEQRELYVRDNYLSENYFKIQQTLAKDGVITPLQLNDEESKTIAKRMPVKSIEAEIASNNNLQNSKRKEILELEKMAFEQQFSYIQSFNSLKAGIEIWENKYILRAPESGQLLFTNVVQEKQPVAEGVVVFFVGNTKINTNYLGEIRLPQSNFGKVKRGQKVIIKFDSFPFEEYGMVVGEIETIAHVSNTDNSYLVQVLLPNKLKTTHKKELIYHSGMTAIAEIITEDLRLSDRLLYNFRKMIQ